MQSLTKYIAVYADGQYIPIHATDEEDASWLAKDLSDDYNTDLVDLIPLRL